MGIPRSREEGSVPWQSTEKSGGLDYVTLLGIAGLSAVAGIATYVGAENIALTCVGVVGGVLYRIYK